MREHYHYPISEYNFFDDIGDKCPKCDSGQTKTYRHYLKSKYKVIRCYNCPYTYFDVNKDN